jgi:polynucleotide 5'-kinase involved in rRNA processing
VVRRRSCVRAPEGERERERERETRARSLAIFLTASACLALIGEKNFHTQCDFYFLAPLDHRIPIYPNQLFRIINASGCLKKYLKRSRRLQMSIISPLKRSSFLFLSSALINPLFLSLIGNTEYSDLLILFLSADEYQVSSSSFMNILTRHFFECRRISSCCLAIFFPIITYNMNPLTLFYKYICANTRSLLSK